MSGNDKEDIQTAKFYNPHSLGALEILANFVRLVLEEGRDAIVAFLRRVVAPVAAGVSIAVSLIQVTVLADLVGHRDVGRDSLLSHFDEDVLRIVLFHESILLREEKEITK